MYLVFSAFTFRLISLLATTKLLCFPLYHVGFRPRYEHHQHKLEADDYHLIKSPPGLPEPS
jgi:hypothetical protein